MAFDRFKLDRWMLHLKTFDKRIWTLTFAHPIETSLENYRWYGTILLQTTGVHTL